jgi:hypothetical protein
MAITNGELSDLSGFLAEVSGHSAIYSLNSIGSLCRTLLFNKAFGNSEKMSLKYLLCAFNPFMQLVKQALP